ncbi:MAG: MBL fold metallo-hydrolase [Candidatus Omnitrophota bacterium]|nr:MBL fold metallo-hydrolase [Candidatus Omnitrophota bacterium]
MAFIKFLGTAGARFVMMEQLRASGGVWISSGSDNLILDPGPGSLVRALESRPKLDPAKLTGVILSHKHLDHSADVNVMIEAMTAGGHTKRGAVFAPQDAFEPEPVIQKYLRNFPERLELLEAGKEYRVGEISFNTVRMLHPVETYGFNFKINNRTVSFITDTAYFPEIPDCFRGEIMIINVVLTERKPEVFHLSVPEVADILSSIKPQKVILTHFGRRTLTANPQKIADRLSQKFGLEIIAATDGMMIEV